MTHPTHDPYRHHGERAVEHQEGQPPTLYHVTRPIDEQADDIGVLVIERVEAVCNDRINGGGLQEERGQ